MDPELSELGSRPATGVAPQAGDGAGPILVGFRRVPHERAWNVGLRTLHLMAFGLLVGGHAWEVEADRLLPTLVVTILSGTGLAGLEVYKSWHWLLMGKGLAVLAKLALLLLVPLFWEARVPLLLAIVAVASVGAHMPARYRHYSLVYRRVLAVQAPAAGRAMPRPRTKSGRSLWPWW